MNAELVMLGQEHIIGTAPAEEERDSAYYYNRMSDQLHQLRVFITNNGSLEYSDMGDESTGVLPDGRKVPTTRAVHHSTYTPFTSERGGGRVPLTTEPIQSTTLNIGYRVFLGDTAVGPETSEANVVFQLDDYYGLSVLINRQDRVHGDLADLCLDSEYTSFTFDSKGKVVEVFTDDVELHPEFEKTARGKVSDPEQQEKILRAKLPMVVKILEEQVQDIIGKGSIESHPLITAPQSLNSGDPGGT